METRKTFACRLCETVDRIPMQNGVSEAILLEKAKQKHHQDNPDCVSDIFLPPTWLVQGILDFAMDIIDRALRDGSCGRGVELFEFGKSEEYFFPMRKMYAMVLAESEERANELLLERALSESETATPAGHYLDRGKTREEIASQWKLRNQYPVAEKLVLYLDWMMSYR